MQPRPNNHDQHVDPDGTDYTIVSEKQQRRAKRRRRASRVVLSLLVLTPVSVLALWIAVHRVGWLGPWLADTLRSVIGTEAVTDLERTAYEVQDWWDLRVRGDEAPRKYWDPPEPEPPKVPSNVSASAAPIAADPEPPVPRFRPQDVGPVFEDKSTDADGRWVPIVDPRYPGEAPLAFKTMVHPDPRRSWSEVFVVALDLPRVSVHYMLGRVDPKAAPYPRPGVERPAKIPKHHWDGLVLAFNGGFKTEHRRYGVKTQDTFVVPGRKGVCTFAKHPGDRLQVRTWEALAPPGETATWLRQTPPCLCEQGEVHPGLRDEESNRWGSLFGKTVIRRSAVGLDREGTTLYVAISNATTARVLTKALRHVGVYDAAQLDVNWSYTKILLFRPGEDGELRAESLVEGFVSDEDEYLRWRSPKDFFYVVRREGT